jgi:hypothetical protein
LLDVYYANNTAFLIFEDAMVAVVKLSNNKAIKDTKVFKIDGLVP